MSGSSEKIKEIPMEDQIKNMQKNLTVLRRLAGWSVKDFAELVDMTPQAIRNLERNNGKPTMSKVQYIAFRSFFEAKIKSDISSDPKNTALEQALHILVDQEDEDVPEETKQQIQLVASAVDNGTSPEVASTTMTTIGEIAATSFGLILGNGLVTIADILAKAIKNSK